AMAMAKYLVFGYGERWWCGGEACGEATSDVASPHCHHAPFSKWVKVLAAGLL
nr:hypothetical protein [Tanacetum cinerariifolium]